jgi:hypothetical protein
VDAKADVVMPTGTTTPSEKALLMFGRAFFMVVSNDNRGDLFQLAAP